MQVLRYHAESILRGVRFKLGRKLPDRNLENIWPGLTEVDIILRPFSGTFGNLKREELIIITTVAKLVLSRKIFEFGTFDGLTTWHLAANCGLDAEVWTLDLPLEHPARFKQGHDRSVGKIQGTTVGSKFIGTPESKRIHQIYGDSLTFNPEPYRGRIDFCFIDASHENEHVRRDTENAQVMVRPGGCIFWHDYSRWWPGVQQCLDTLSESLPLFRVPGTALAAVRLPE